MKSRTILLFLTVLICTPALAQRHGYGYSYYPYGETASVQGSLVLNHDHRLNSLLYSDNATTSDSISVHMPGFRVQVYSNNNPRKSKNEAINLAKKLKEEYLGHKVYVSYSAPFWKVRIGDFATYFDALLFARRISGDYPKMSGDVFVMKESSAAPIMIKGIGAQTPEKSRGSSAHETAGTPSHKSSYYDY